MMRYFKNQHFYTGLLLTLVFMGISSPAFAAQCISVSLFGARTLSFCLNSCTVGSSATVSLGDLLCNVVVGTRLIPTFLAAIAYLIGITLVFLGLFKARDYVTDPRQTPFVTPVKYFFASGLFFSLPFLTSVLEGSLLGGNGGIAGLDTTGVVGLQSGQNLGVAGLFFGFIRDIFDPMKFLIRGFTYVAGLVLIMIGISRMLKGAQDGPKGPGGFGTIMTFLAAGVLLNFSEIMALMNETIFGLNNEVLTYVGGTSILNIVGAGLGVGGLDTCRMTGDAFLDDNINIMLTSILGFMIILGIIAFIRGIFLLRAVAEGNQQTSFMAAMTHMIGGSIAVNLGALINVTAATFQLPIGCAFT